MHKRSKNSRQRATHTHGWGSKKKHRGKGNKGGAGKAGTGKRSDQKKPNVWADRSYFGRYGFVFNAVKQGPSISVRSLQADLPGLVEKGSASESKGTYTVDLGALGYDKLIATGVINVPVKVTVKKASSRAVEKIEAAGGTVTISESSRSASEGSSQTSRSAQPAQPAQ